MATYNFFPKLHPKIFGTSLPRLCRGLAALLVPPFGWPIKSILPRIGFPDSHLHVAEKPTFGAPLLKFPAPEIRTAT